jgi:hypothetical protein
MGIEEEVQAKRIHNIFKKQTTTKKPRKFPKSQERFILSGTEVPEASRTPNRHDQNKTSPQHVIKTTNTEKEKEY